MKTDNSRVKHLTDTVAGWYVTRNNDENHVRNQNFRRWDYLFYHIGTCFNSWSVGHSSAMIKTTHFITKLKS